MRKRLVAGVLFFAALCAGPATAGKIGFVDAERAVAQVKEGALKLQELEEWAAPRRQQLEVAAARVTEIRKQINDQRNVSSRETLERLQRDEVQARRDFEDQKRQFDRDLAAKQDEFLADVAVKVGAVATDYGEQNEYDAIFVLKAQPLVFVSDSADLTDTIIRLYDTRFPPKS